MPPLHFSDSVLARTLDDQSLLLNLNTGQCFVLNGVAARMWSLLRERARRERTR